jgi:hypothetical protein
MRLTKVMHAIAHALSMLNSVESSNACSSARDSDLYSLQLNDYWHTSEDSLRRASMTCAKRHAVDARSVET